MIEIFSVKSFFIQGKTHSGENFRPSDWAERLCSAMASFGKTGRTRLTYSSYAVPLLYEGVKSIRVDKQLNAIEPLAYQFLIGFAEDNDLVVIEIDH